MFKEIDYIIYYEHVSRELEGVKRLHERLKEKHLRGVVLPIHFNIYTNILKYKPKIIITPFFYNENTPKHIKMFKEMYNNVLVLNLHSEQITNESTVKYKLPQDIISKNVFHASWGEKYKEKLIEIGVPEKNIFVTGSIRVDSSLDYLKKIKVEKNKILIPTSFSITFVPDSYLSHLKRDEISQKNLEEKLKFTKESRDLFFKEVYKFSKLYKKYNIVMRPHPFVDMKEYENKFLELNNIKSLPNNIIIERKGSIQEAISSSEIIIVWHSTSLLEAVIMEKKTLVLAPIPFEKRFGMDFMNYIPIAEKAEDIIEKINNYKNSEELKAYIHDMYGKIDGEVAKHLESVIEKIILNNKITQHLNNLKILKYIPLVLKDKIKNIFLRIGVLDKFFKNYKGILEDNFSIEEL